jgi:hypothetical protein
VLQECESDDSVSEMSADETDEAIEIDETFTKNSRFPGTVKIIVESTTFWFALLLVHFGGMALLTYHLQGS